MSKQTTCMHMRPIDNINGEIVCKDCGFVLAKDAGHVKGVNYDVGQRWEKGVDHRPESLELFKRMAAIDFHYNDDYFCWKSGGDGDNGESLMYLLDIYFDELDKKKKK